MPQHFSTVEKKSQPGINTASEQNLGWGPGNEATRFGHRGVELTLAVDLPVFVAHGGGV